MTSGVNIRAHTAGPWRVSGKATINGPRGWVASVSTTDRDANARLIAAAPDLLAALRELEAAMKRDFGPGYAGVALAQAAIAKAEAQEARAVLERVEATNG